MLAEIEAGRVAVCCTKDLSRLGRNSSLTGLYINFTFPKYNVRYIAINDHFDTIDPNSTDSDIAGIKNWFNEFFAKDTSRKIRAVNKAKGERGVPLTVNVPFDYRKDPEDKTKWIVDEAAALVKWKFRLCGRKSKLQERQIENLEQFIQRVRKYEDLDELIPYALRELVKAIYIEAPDKSSGKRHQGIRISYDLVGFIPVEELLKQETA